MRRLIELLIQHGDRRRIIALYEGDLARIPLEERVDVLVISAFPNNYWPSPGSLIGALDASGLSVERLATYKAADLRKTFSCWLSEDLEPHGGLQFRRLLCFEPAWRGEPPEVVSDIFQSLASTVLTEGEEMSVAMPLVASGDMRWSPEEMFVPLLEAAVVWFEKGLPITALKIVERSPEKAARLKKLFEDFLSRPRGERVATGRPVDAVISYSHNNADKAMAFAHQLQQVDPSLNIFVDREDLTPGTVWLEKIFSAIGRARRVVAFYSPDYLDSRYCRDEFLAAIVRENDERIELLFPVYLFSVEALPLLYKIRHFADCREGNDAKLKRASATLLKQLSST